MRALDSANSSASTTPATGGAVDKDYLRRKRLEALGEALDSNGGTSSTTDRNMNGVDESGTLIGPQNGSSASIEPKSGPLAASAVSSYASSHTENQSALRISTHMTSQTVDRDVNMNVSTPDSKQYQPRALQDADPPLSQPSPATKQAWLTTCYKTAQPLDIRPCHEVLWDPSHTTESDQSRWVNQGIHVRENAPRLVSTTATDAEGCESASVTLDQLSASFLPWGLLQQHGGPCGVLAAVQAELVRQLLYASQSSVATEEHGENNDYSNDTDTAMSMSPSPPPAAETDLVTLSLARALGIIIARASLTPSAAVPDAKASSDPSSSSSSSSSSASFGALAAHIVLPVHPNATVGLVWEDLEPWPRSHSPSPAAQSSSFDSSASPRLATYTITPLPVSSTNSLSKRQRTSDLTSSSAKDSLPSRIYRLGEAITTFLLTPAPENFASLQRPLDVFEREGGVLLLVLSLLQSRGVREASQECDYPATNKLTAQFGHCSQELINLLLTGQAVSNVFDNTLSLGGDMVCRGISSRPSIGYLSQLEALRYCEVGDYYKSPQYPIWVIGSTSHFSVMFGDGQALQESKSDRLLEQCRRAFKSIEGADENGFIATSDLGKVLSELQLDLGDSVPALAAALEVTGADIILWDEFWKSISRLLTGATLESVLAGPTEEVTVINVDPPVLEAAVETDEEMARRLAKEWGTDGGSSVSSPSANNNTLATLSEAAERISSSMSYDRYQVDGVAHASNVSNMSNSNQDSNHDSDQNVLSDEELARKLQAEWDAEISGGTTSSVAGVSGSPTPGESDMSSTAPINMDEEEEDTKPSAVKTDGKLDFETYGDTFILYHYNGLRGGALTPFRVTRLTAEEAVGSSIALNRGNSAQTSAGGSGDLEDVVRTKWPSCMINWLGKNAPYID
jgi:ubiquitin carboxyl-terminal hydrolase MINDY-3/4